MIINAAYEGPPYSVMSPTGLTDCTSCRRGASLNTSPIAGLSYTTVGTLALATLAIMAIGITVWGFKSRKRELQGRRRRMN